MKEGNHVWVPGLKSNFIYRDSWTRLNVRPAKIMQVVVMSYLGGLNTLAELTHFVSSAPETEDAKSADATRKYLEACYYLFERGILNSGISLHKPDGFIIKQMERGQKFFSSWLDELLSTGLYTKSKQCLIYRNA